MIKEKYTINSCNLNEYSHEKTEYIEKNFLNRNLTILIGADFVHTESNQAAFENGDCETLFGNELLKLLMQSDLNIFNLEAPFTKSNNELLKAGSPNIKCSPQSIELYKKLSPMVLSGANNHILDFKEEGLEDTIKILDKHNIKHVGFGSTIDKASKTLIINVKGLRVGIYACAENEFSIAKENRGGANGYDPLVTFDDIVKAKTNCDYLIVLYHGGRENYRYPSLQLKRICKKMIFSGADLVVCQHSHCVGAYEIVGNKTIVYGQGNFLFDYNNIEEWETSILLEIKLVDSGITISAIPLEKHYAGVRLASKRHNEIITSFIERSILVQDDKLLENEWKKFCLNQSQALLLRGVMGFNNRLILGINRRFLKNILEKYWFKKKNRCRLLLNYLRCESIRESILTLLEDKLE